MRIAVRLKENVQTPWGQSAGLGLFSTGLAMVLAVAAVPQDVEAKGTLRIPALLLAAGLVAAPMATVWRSPRSMFHPVYLVAFAPVYWLLLDPIQGAYDVSGISADTARFALIA